MPSKPISAKVIFALALVVLMAWVGHSSALMNGASPPAWGDKHAHAHSHGNDVPICSICADHFHSSLTADHVHETPHLNTPLGVSAQSKSPALLRDASSFVPAAPIFLFKRPPRPDLVC
ncbi:hypothetical protein DT594_10530 [Halopseudomonas laoshanensis]|uniref:Uncharacterized protein n=2 Tax=Halopseudomonas TaxID=2901189 RepID=A0A7V7GUM8_9GAMM|nr:MULTISPECIES: hypothetical protein [Halopseudomonas]MBQ0742540.1 hypothetical protein [Pseudomonas sp.]WOD11824.1 hypothetical protein RPW65_02830 [Pseudomonas sp. NyZ704]KAA0695258.1 hypothetical protein DT594_10530 [Halopseudomonas laoshanensis]PCC98776.1 hypothetical protein CO192_14080 [Halopseudomonas pelagia]QFY58386.1 hypothetical protein EAO82_19700 [Halopseudomonas pelagia]